MCTNCNACIKTSNEMIAEFMEIDLTEKKGYEFSLHAYACKYQFNFNDGWYTGELLFNKCWDWLMPVIEKIEKIGETEARFGTLVNITTSYVKVGEIIIDLKTNIITPNYQTPKKIDVTYKAVVRYIRSLSAEEMQTCV